MLVASVDERMEGGRDEGRKQKVLMGTCGWSDDTLLRCGRFYPASVRSAEDRLRHYSTHFPCVEVDTSTYAIPSKVSVRRWLQAVPPGFVFHFKAFGLFCSKSCPITAIPGDIRCKLSFAGGADYVKLSSLSTGFQDEIWAAFNSTLEPVFAAGSLGVVLFQFHLTFKPSADNRAHVLWCRRQLDPRFEMAVEFRNRDWFIGENFLATCDWLKANNMALVAADELAHETYQRDREQTGLPEGQIREILPVAWAVTKPSFHYIRVHRREGSKRLLSDSELQIWVARLQIKLPEILQGPIYFMWGTDWEDQPIINARNLKQLLPTSMIFNWKAAQLESPARGSLLSMFKTAQAPVQTTPDSVPKQLPDVPANDITQRALLEMSNTVKLESPSGKLGDTQKKRTHEPTVDTFKKAVASPPQLKKAKPSPNKRKSNTGSVAPSSTITSFFKPASSGT